METLWSDYYDKDKLTSAFSSADPNTIAAMLSIKGVISKKDEAKISLASTPRKKATILITAIELQIKSSTEKFRDFLNAVQKANLLPDDIEETLKLWSDYYDKDILILAFSSADLDTIAAVLSIKGVISKEDEAQISLASTSSEKAKLLVITMKHQIKNSPEKFRDFLNALSEANLSLPDDIVKILWSDYTMTKTN